MRTALSAIALLLVLAGCGGQAFLIDRAGTQHGGKFDTMTRTLEVNVGGKLYSGHYITNQSVTPVYTTGMVGTRMVGANTLAVTPGNAGRALLRASDGSTIECEFSYQGNAAIGTCRGNDGATYQLTTR